MDLIHSVEDLNRTKRLSKILYHWLWFSFSGEPGLIQKGNFLNLTKNIYKKPTAGVILSGKRVNAFLLKHGTRCLFSPLLFNIILEILARAIRQEKETNDILVGKEKLSLFAEYMIA